MGADDFDGDAEGVDIFAELGEHFVHEGLEDGGFDEGVVADDIDGAAALVGGGGEEALDDEVEEERRIFAAGKADDPRRVVRLKILGAQAAADGLQFGEEFVEIDHGRETRGARAGWQTIPSPPNRESALSQNSLGVKAF